jgi:SAM-dependent methyltransferase
MQILLLEILRCPRTGQRLTLREPVFDGERVRSGWLDSADGAQRYPIREYVPRFVPESNYADNFGMQWNKFSRTQLDSFTGLPISGDRFWKATGWRPEDVAGRWVLDTGCGSGRFAEVALGASARVVALDYSSAVDACFRNLQAHANLHVVQGDIYALPFPPRQFDFVYSLGVLQHTPDVARAFAALPTVTAPGGRVCVDFYDRTWHSLLHPKYWLRPVTKRVPKTRLFALLERLVPKLLPVSTAIGRVPVVGGALRHLIPVANYAGRLPLSDRQNLEWALLDTFDWLSPQFDNPQTAATVARWFAAAGLTDVEVLKAGHLVGRGAMPSLGADRTRTDIE